MNTANAGKVPGVKDFARQESVGREGTPEGQRQDGNGGATREIYSEYPLGEVVRKSVGQEVMAAERLDRVIKNRRIGSFGQSIRLLRSAPTYLLPRPIFLDRPEGCCPASCRVQL
jgi:hypothetical protein